MPLIIQNRRQGEIMSRTIELTQGYVAVVDVGDYQRVEEAGPWFPLISKRKDGSIRSVRARRNVRVNGKAGQQYMGQFILDVHQKGVDVSHLDNDGLNCTRKNLRKSTRSQTCVKQRLRKDNRFKLKGVTTHTTQQGNTYFQAQLGHVYLGSFSTANQAGKAYDAAALAKYGEFALLNFPQQSTTQGKKNN